MQDSFVMCGFDSGANLTQQSESTLHRHGPFAAQELIKRFSLDVFHYQEKHALVALAKVGDVDDIRMLNRSGRTRFALEPRDRFAFLQVFIRKYVGTNRLDRNPT